MVTVLEIIVAVLWGVVIGVPVALAICSYKYPRGLKNLVKDVQEKMALHIK